MEINTNTGSPELDKSRGKDLSPTDKRSMFDSFNKTYTPQEEQLPGGGLKFLTEYADIENKDTPDKAIPKELFNFELILNSRKFKVMCDMLMSVHSDEDLLEYSENRLNWCLDQCSSYRFTCFCAYAAAHKEVKSWKRYHNNWMSEKRTEARHALRIERMQDRQQGILKASDFSQTTIQEIEDWVATHHPEEYNNNLKSIEDWISHEETFLELRDTIKDRGSHLQTLMRRLNDKVAPKLSDPTQSEIISEH